MPWLLLASGATGTVLGAFLRGEGVAGQALLVFGLVLLAAGVGLAFRLRGRTPMAQTTRGLWVILTGLAVGWGLGLAIGTVPRLASGDTDELLDPAVFLSGLGAIFGAGVGLAVVIGLLTRPKD
ncbi:hypothetical protein [Knoellia remsis]|uniref:hypothetical protein n=1 Tax=Knoellia remsis TaxID=407159 RepID=UPI0014756DE3|nr:hypothetical protein [Knoellia remsis]